MTLDDLKRLFTRQTLFKLDSILSPKLVPILYALGLCAILLWAVNHLFFTFGYGFGTGLWGLLEIAVFGLLSWILLRIGCEALLVYFKTHEVSGDSVNRSRFSTSLLDEVRDAIRDLAEEGEDPDYAEADEYITPATEPGPFYAQPSPPASSARGPATEPGEVVRPKRTARRSPPAPRT
ncbi:MAG: DUF4282 domain-containing protein [Devosia sp.]